MWLLQSLHDLNVADDDLMVLNLMALLLLLMELELV
jgi:hypothetical protein